MAQDCAPGDRLSSRLSVLRTQDTNDNIETNTTDSVCRGNESGLPEEEMVLARLPFPSQSPRPGTTLHTPDSTGDSFIVLRNTHTPLSLMGEYDELLLAHADYLS
jgi:hypothetical protein